MHNGIGENCQLMEKNHKGACQEQEPLAIGTLAPLHRLLSQQDKSHVLTLDSRLSRNLQPSSQIPFVAQSFL